MSDWRENKAAEATFPPTGWKHSHKHFNLTNLPKCENAAFNKLATILVLFIQIIIQQLKYKYL